ncbi:hypothetical protein T01_6204 [Trichinella spiralis]|uniref:Uncharacterized protein n=1 Tax=Trichinella spiralis TaxID=6334 RepID=A0A0V1B9Q0_TRISP|nr:hypothetical protein T01_6204 [Trichinella spiralis]
MENQKALQTCAIISQSSYAIKHQVDNLLANGVVTTGIVVGRILFSVNQLLWMKKLSLRTNHTGLKIDKDSTRHMTAGPSFTEKCGERVVCDSETSVCGHLTVRLNAMLQAVQLPTSIANLHSCLTDVNADYFALKNIRSLLITLTS